MLVKSGIEVSFWFQVTPNIIGETATVKAAILLLPGPS